MIGLQLPHAPQAPRPPHAGGAGFGLPHPFGAGGFPRNGFPGGGILHRDVGGTVDPTQSGIGGVTPSAQTQAPLMQGMIQRYASLPTEKLTELGAMMGGSAQGQVIQHLLQQRAGGAVLRRDSGGDMGISPSQGTPWWTRSQARGEDSTTGFLHGSTPGRADAVKTQSPTGSYVFPADVVSGMGEGNSLSGARIMQGILDSGPHGIPMPREARGMGVPRAPAPYKDAKGGSVPAASAGQTRVDLSHGEFVATPEHARSWGGGDIARGHRIFDKWVLAMRARQIKKLKSLPGPVKT
jgi:hypothetical protein